MNHALIFSGVGEVKTYKRMLLLFLGLLVLMAGCSSGPVEEKEQDEFVSFGDPHLEQAVRESLGKPQEEITATEMELLEELILLGKGVADLSGLEYAVNLRSLNLRSNAIKDLTPLSGLINLEELNLADNDIEDLTPLRDLTGLKRLDLNLNRIGEFTSIPWTSFTYLEYLDIRFNYIDLEDQSVIDQVNYLQEKGVSVLYEPMY